MPFKDNYGNNLSLIEINKNLILKFKEIYKYKDKMKKDNIP